MFQKKSVQWLQMMETSSYQSKLQKYPLHLLMKVIIKVEAAPINPSDLGLLLSFAADISSISTSGSGDETITTMKIHPALMGAMKPRLDESMQVGNEGAGVIVDAGDNAKDLIGKTVGLGRWSNVFSIQMCSGCKLFSYG
jgi:NADPH:quinone reductase-like Zn-dependent oxidoreductase